MCGYTKDSLARYPGESQEPYEKRVFAAFRAEIRAVCAFVCALSYCDSNNSFYRTIGFRFPINYHLASERFPDIEQKCLLGEAGVMELATGIFDLFQDTPALKDIIAPNGVVRKMRDRINNVRNSKKRKASGKKCPSEVCCLYRDIAFNYYDCSWQQSPSASTIKRNGRISRTPRLHRIILSFQLVRQ